MFYKQKEVDQTITCQICARLFKDPRNLPCGETACLECIQHLIKSSQDEKFECTLCKSDHAISSEFPMSKLAVKLMDTKPDHVYRNPIVTELQANLVEIKQRNDELERLMSNGADVITERCVKLRNKVDLEIAVYIEKTLTISEKQIEETGLPEKVEIEETTKNTDLLVEQAHRSSEKSIAGIDQYEESCLQSFNTKIDRFKSQFGQKLNEISQFYVENTQKLQDFVIDDQFMSESLAKSHLYLQKLLDVAKSLKILLNNGVELEFEKPDEKCELGELVYTNIGFQNMQCIKLMDRSDETDDSDSEEAFETSRFVDEDDYEQEDSDDDNQDNYDNTNDRTLNDDYKSCISFFKFDNGNYVLFYFDDEENVWAQFCEPDGRLIKETRCFTVLMNRIKVHCVGKNFLFEFESNENDFCFAFNDTLNIRFVHVHRHSDTESDDGNRSNGSNDSNDSNNRPDRPIENPIVETKVETDCVAGEKEIWSTLPSEGGHCSVVGRRESEISDSPSGSGWVRCRVGQQIEHFPARPVEDLSLLRP
jgi:hypothetical protein